MSAMVDVVVYQQEGGCSNDGGDGGSNGVAMAATRTGIGQRNEIR